MCALYQTSIQTLKVAISITCSVENYFPRGLKYTCVSLPFSDVYNIALTYGKDKRKSFYTPEQYGRKQLGLQSSFFMNWICPLSFRQKKFLSPRTKTEDADWLKDIILISRACSPMFKVQSTCKRKPKINLVAKKQNIMVTFMSILLRNFWLLGKMEA